jgi:hypothetical protein
MNKQLVITQRYAIASGRKIAVAMSIRFRNAMHRLLIFFDKLPSSPQSRYIALSSRPLQISVNVNINPRRHHDEAEVYHGSKNISEPLHHRRTAQISLSVPVGPCA